MLPVLPVMPLMQGEEKTHTVSGGLGVRCTRSGLSFNLAPTARTCVKCQAIGAAGGSNGSGGSSSSDIQKMSELRGHAHPPFGQTTALQQRR